MQIVVVEDLPFKVANEAEEDFLALPFHHIVLRNEQRPQGQADVLEPKRHRKLEIVQHD